MRPMYGRRLRKRKPEGRGRTGLTPVGMPGGRMRGGVCGRGVVTRGAGRGGFGTCGGSGGLSVVARTRRRGVGGVGVKF